MPFKIVTLDKANIELAEALNWYVLQQDGLVELFRGHFRKDVISILNNPESYPEVKKGYRKAVMQTFPYVILYSINKKKQVITIVSIFHTSRHPKQKFRK